MHTKIRALVIARDTMEAIDDVLNCISAAVTSRPLDPKEMNGVQAILQWSGERLGKCSRELGNVIDQLGKVPS